MCYISECFANIVKYPFQFVAIAALAIAVANGAPQGNFVEVRSRPIATIRSSYNALGTAGYERSFDQSFETENGIQQESSGELRLVGDSEVMVMRGSYSFIAPDGLTYIVDWYADETGYHPSAPHLPVAPAIPFPEQQAAVDAQVRFAAENPIIETTFDNSFTTNTFSSNNFGFNK